MDKKIFSIFSAEVSDDGISVISESEVFKTTASNNDSDNEEKTVKAEDTESDLESYRPLTPPMTPDIQAGALKGRDGEIGRGEIVQEPENGNKTLFIGVALCVVASILYSHISGLNSSIHAINLKLSQLEYENQLLKTSLDKIVASCLGPEASEVFDPLILDNPAANILEAESRPSPKPKTKTVWLGSEKEDKVEILDKKHNSLLPAYCYFTDENDLFYEYNVEICEAKRRKLEAKNARRDKKIEKELKVDDSSKMESDKSYDDYITEALKSFNDEIQEIKKQRPESSETKDGNEISQKTKGEQQEKPNKRREKRLHKQKAVKSGEWVEKRMNGREEARNNHDKQDTVNWYLKRNNDREINRLESDPKPQE